MRQASLVKNIRKLSLIIVSHLTISIPFFHSPGLRCRLFGTNAEEEPSSPCKKA